MNAITLFYSWQSDRDREVCGNFIRMALQEAINTCDEEHGIAIHLDSDTQGVPGTPPVSETILKKIRECEIFVGDVTFVATTAYGKQLPNPNVMIELGYARGVLSDQQMLSVMNTAFGSAKELPFDLAHLRHPTSYSLEEGAADSVRRKCRAAFAAKLTPILKAIAENVLKRREATKPEKNLIAPAVDLVTGIRQMNGRAETPIIVSGPRLTLQLVTASAAGGTTLIPAQVNTALAGLHPTGYREKQSHANVREWANFDPTRTIPGKPNPEGRWYIRILRSGALEAAVTIGERIDDDPDIVVDIAPLEGRIVELAERMGDVARAIGLDGPLVIHAALEDTEDVKLFGQHRASRPLRQPNIELGLEVIPSVSAITTENLRPVLDALWLAAGFADGSPLFADGLSETERRRQLATPEAVGRGVGRK
ncbi:hypothetical protein [Agrobacterium cavarae]|uniref:hypothetical protein n=1 Tax=Agrobacterium cavarae TaxID=2528239 RepID=UPI0028A1F43A|nr:hypothetical protein [Agrobacterium cavarae]